MELKAGYKQTEVGVIPEDWEVAPIGDLVSISVGRDLKKENYSLLQDEQFKYPVFSNTVSNEGLYGYYNISEYFGDSLTVVGRGVGLGTAFKKSGGFGAIGRLLVLSPIPNIDANYLTEYINGRVKIFTETGGIPQLTGVSIAKYRILLPSTKAEQEAIAEALSDADALIESLEQLIAKKRLIKQGAMQELLTGKKRLFGFQKHKGFTHCELGLIPKDWHCMQLPTLTIPSTSSIKIGPFGSALKKEYLTKDGFKVYGQENVYAKNMNTGDRFINSEHFKKLRSCEIKTGDFLISMMGTVGKCLIVPAEIKDGIMDSHLLRLRLDSEKLCPDYLAQLFETKIIFDQVKQLSVGGIMEGLSSKIIRSLNLPVPTVNEQVAIAQILIDMDTEIDALETKLSKARAIKQGMMQELLTGKTRLI